jgi:hypothetical protein
MLVLAGGLPGEIALPPARQGFRGHPDAAIEAYLASRHASRLGTAEDHPAARVHLERAISLAPDFALAHATLAATMGNLSMYEKSLLKRRGPSELRRRYAPLP